MILIKKKCAIQQNDELRLDDNNFRILFERKPTDRQKRFRDVIIITSWEIRKKILVNGIYIGLEVIRAADYVRPTQCFRCHRIGHIAKHCRAELSTTKCRNCGNQHEGKCQKPVENYILKNCINCETFNKKIKNNEQKRDDKHSPYDHCCPTMKEAFQQDRIELKRLNNR